MLAKDINGTLYLIGYMHGVYSLRTEQGELLGYDTNLIRLVKSTLGYHAEVIQ